MEQTITAGAVPAATTAPEGKNRVTILVIGDPHFKRSDIELTSLMCRETVRVARERKPTAIMLMGDVNDTHGNAHIEPMCRAHDWFDDLQAIAPTYLLIGNHDRENNSVFMTNIHPFPGLRHWPKLKVVASTRTFDIGGFWFTMVPYVPPGRFQEAIQADPDYDAKRRIAAYFAHQEFRGAKYNTVKSTKGDVWPEDRPLVVSGHIHKYQRLQGNIHYVGTPRQINFNDDGGGTVSLYTFTSGPDGAVSITDERIALALPAKLLVELDAKTASSYAPPVNTQVKLKVSGTEGEIAAFQLAAEQRLKSAGVQLQYLLTGAADAGDLKGGTGLTNPASQESFSQRLQIRLSTSRPDLLPYMQKMWGTAILQTGPPRYAAAENSSSRPIQSSVSSLHQPTPHQQVRLQ